MYKKVLVLIADGFEEVEALTPVDLLRRVNIEAVMVSCSEKLVVKGAHGVKVVCDMLLDNLEDEDVEDAFGIVLPGGMPGAENLKNSEGVKYIIKDMMSKKKLVAAICAAPIVLAETDVIDGRRITSYPGFQDELKAAEYMEDSVVLDDNLITARGPAIAMDFALAIVEYLCGREKRHSLANEVLRNMI
ncbi:MAG: DJ-1/PfpI family protein [Clostridiales bacterium]|nr:DJ-1/PfpI family protein [Clostridiales bacterium]MDY4060563.1 DJ-1 family glyoxalase III [Anaerovoracaceae bacterium]